MTYTYDTETSYQDGRAWVWSWGLCDEALRTTTGDGRTALKALQALPDGSTVWVHNLSYDGEFLVWLLYDAGYRLVYGHDYGVLHWCYEPTEDLQGMIKLVIWTEGRKVTLRDSFRLFRCRLEELPKLCGFAGEDAKEEMDYDRVRPVDYVKTAAEDSYQRHDVTILMRAILWLRDQGAEGNTIGAIAINQLKAALGGKSPFRPLSIDERDVLRSLYSGGVVKLDDAFAGQILDIPTGKVYDRNSMYPAEATNVLPVRLRGFRVDPLPASPSFDSSVVHAVHVLAEGLTLRRNGFPLIVTPFTGNARRHIPAIDKWFYLPEWNVIREDYDITSYRVIDWASFDQEAFAGPFVGKWYDVKSHSEGSRRTFAKYVLNNFTGKLAQNPQVEQVRRMMTPDGWKGYRYNEVTNGTRNKWLFMPATAAITSRSRLALRDADRKTGGGVYNDTDSVFTAGELPAEMIDKAKLGAWDCENTFTRACFIKPKSYYLLDGSDVVKVKHAGLSKKALVCDEQGRIIGGKISPENMRPGQTYLTPHVKHVKGGAAILGTVKHI